MSDALKKLIDAVGAGEDFVGAPLNMAVDALSADCGTTDYEFAVWFRDAARGSLDSAKALHDSLLHEAAWASISHSKRYEGESTAEVTLAGGTWQARSDNLARAWLLAVLKAKLQEDQP